MIPRLPETDGKIFVVNLMLGRILLVGTCLYSLLSLRNESWELNNDHHSLREEKEKRQSKNEDDIIMTSNGFFWVFFSSLFRTPPSTGDM
jgi:hypothetical protein